MKKALSKIGTQQMELGASTAFELYCLLYAAESVGNMFRDVSSDHTYSLSYLKAWSFIQQFVFNPVMRCLEFLSWEPLNIRDVKFRSVLSTSCIFCIATGKFMYASRTRQK